MQGSADLDTHPPKRSCVPSFAQGLSILVVDQDTASLLYLASLLEEYAYNVTTTELATIALAMIAEQPDRFKLVIATNHLSDLNIMFFLKTLRQKGIPVILMSTDKKFRVAIKALRDGACFYLEKPISSDDLKYVWQHAITKKKSNQIKLAHAKETYVGNEKKEVQINLGKSSLQGIKIKEGDDASREKKDGVNIDLNDPKGKKKVILIVEEGENGNRVEEYQSTNIRIDPLIMSRYQDGQNSPSDTKELNENTKSAVEKIIRSVFDGSGIEGTEEEDKGDNNFKKQRMAWNKDLQLKFTAALSALSDKQARPKSILSLMDVPELTQRQVASHLQKYKAQVQRISESNPNGNIDPSFQLSNPMNFSLPGLPVENNSLLLQSGSLQNQTWNNSSLLQSGAPQSQTWNNSSLLQPGALQDQAWNNSSFLQSGPLQDQAWNNSSLLQSGPLQDQAWNNSSLMLQSGTLQDQAWNNSSCLQSGSSSQGLWNNNLMQEPVSFAPWMNNNNSVMQLGSPSSLSLQNNNTMLQPESALFNWPQTNCPMLQQNNNSLLQTGSSLNEAQNNATMLPMGSSSFVVQNNNLLLQPEWPVQWMQNDVPMFQPGSSSGDLQNNNAALQFNLSLEVQNNDLMLQQGSQVEWLENNPPMLQKKKSSSTSSLPEMISILQPESPPSNLLGDANNGLLSGGIFDSEMETNQVPENMNDPNPVESSVPPDSNVPPPAVASQGQNQDVAGNNSLQELFDIEMEETTANGNEPNPEDVDQFCQWLRNVLIGIEE